jgi:hypothetical protein
MRGLDSHAMRTMKALAAGLLAATLVSGCGGGDGNGPTGPNASCSALNLTGTRTLIVRGGCEGGVVSTQNGEAQVVYNSTNCLLTGDITPPAVKNTGGTWTLTADFRNGTASVVRANTACPGTDTGTARIDPSTVTMEVRAPADPSCDCRLVYLVSINRPL